VRALVTGGGGFLGGAIVAQLLEAGHRVTVAARGEYPQLAARGVHLVRVDVADAPGTRAAVEGHDVVFHAAARAGVWGPRDEYERTNVLGTRNVIAACREAGVARLVYTSSPSVVFDGCDHEGAANDLPYPSRYESIYPETKAVAERLVLAANGPELATVALRPHLIYGPGDPHLLPRLVTRARARRLRVVGDGTNRVGLTYVGNAAVAHLQAARRLTPDAACAGRAYFVHDPEPVVLWPWIECLLARLGLPRPVGRVSLGVARAAGAVAETTWSLLGLPGEPPITRFVAAQLASSHWYDLEPAERDIGYAPLVNGEEGFERTLAWWRAGGRA
jgi:nucleoside-diphosphate-sugar epimerase